MAWPLVPELRCALGRDGRADPPEGRLDALIATVMAQIRPNREHPFRLIKGQFGFQKNCCTVNVLPALTNLFIARHLLPC
jgi:IS5 family transposase